MYQRSQYGQFPNFRSKMGMGQYWVQRSREANMFFFFFVNYSFTFPSENQNIKTLVGLDQTPIPNSNENLWGPKAGLMNVYGMSQIPIGWFINRGVCLPLEQKVTDNIW